MAELDPNKRRTQPDVSANGVPTTDENYMLPSQAAPQPARRGIYPDNGPVGTIATAASVPAAGALGVYAAKNPGAITGAASRAANTLGRVIAGPIQAAQGAYNAMGLGNGEMGPAESTARATLGGMAMLPPANPATVIPSAIGRVGSTALTIADETGLTPKVRQGLGQVVDTLKTDNILRWLRGQGPQATSAAQQPNQAPQVATVPNQAPPAPQSPSAPDIPDAPQAPAPGPVRAAATRAADGGARTEEMARLNQQADQELRNAGMDQLIQSLIAREGQQPSSLPAQGGIARIGTQYDAKGGAPLAGYVLPSQAAQATDYSPVEMILGNQRTMATAVQGPDGPVFRKNPVVGAPQLEGLEPAQVTKYVNDLVKNGQMTPEMFKSLIEGGFARANNIETTSGGIAQQAVAGETQRAVAGTQAASAGNVAGIQLEGTKYTADKPQIVSSDNLVGYDSMGNPVYKRQQIVVDRNGNVITNPAANTQPATPIKPGQQAPRALTPQQWEQMRNDKRFATPEQLRKFLLDNNLQPPR